MIGKALSLLKNSNKFYPLAYSPARYFTAKIFKNSMEAIEDVKDGSTIAIGGFGICGIPENSLRALKELNSKKLTIYSNTAGIDDYGVGMLIKNNQVKRLVASYIGENNDAFKKYMNGKLEVEFVPQGTLAEMGRAGGAGIPGFYTATGVGTWVENGKIPIKFDKTGKKIEIYSKKKERKTFNKRDYILEETIRPDFSIIKAWRADTKGNLIFKKSSMNFNSDFAQCGKVTIAEVEEIVEAGEIPPEQVHIPGVFIHRLVLGEYFEKKIERLKLSPSVSKKPKEKGKGEKKKETKKKEKKLTPKDIKMQKEKEHAQWVRMKIAQRAAKEMKDGMYVNLGIGIPTLLPAFLPKNCQVELHSEIGIIGCGGYPTKEEVDPDLVNASKETCTVNPGASYMPSSGSFAVVRGGHLQMTALGGMQVSKTGDLANWYVPRKLVKGMGGGMDLVFSKSKLIVLMQHAEKNGSHKILEKCTLPLTGPKVVTMLITEMAVFQWINGEMTLTEIAKESNLEKVKKSTGCTFKIAKNLKTF